MIKIERKEECCGCWACENICPKHCIEMKEDKEGFRYPVVDVDQCIECGLCEKACPLKKEKPEVTQSPRSYVVQNNDADILRHSTSGGFFTAISKYAIERGGCVFGAAFDETMTLRHQKAETMEDCGKFRGSKYIQSLIGKAYSEALHELKNGRVVVFSGTGCQIAGLYGFLNGKKFDNLITVDLVCHGVPSPLLFSKFVKNIECKFGSRIVNYLSRDKYYGYDYSTAAILFKDPAISCHLNGENNIMSGTYFKGLCSRPSCYECHFRTLNRLSDFTIFDCWNAPAVSSIFSRKGATNVFLHTQKAADVFEVIKQDFVYAPSNLEKIVATDGVMIREQPRKHPKREQFFSDLSEGMSIDNLQKKYNDRGLPKKLFLKVKPFLYRIGLWSLYMRLKQIVVS